MSLLIRIASRNILSHWRQSLAALISVTTGFIAFSLFDGYLLNTYHAIADRSETLDMLGDVIIEKKGASEAEGRSEPLDWALSAADQNIITKSLSDHRSQILGFSRFLKIEGSIDSGDTSYIFYGFGYDISGGRIIQGRWHWNTYWGKPLAEQQDYSQYMILGRRLGQFMGCLPDHLGDMSKYALDLENHPQDRPFLCADKSFQLTSVTDKGQVNAIDMSVSGLYDQGMKEFDERLVVLPIEAAQSLYDTEKVNYYAVKLKDGVNINEFIADFTGTLKNTSVQFNVQHWKDHVFGDIYRQSKAILDIDRIFVISIIIFVGCMSVFNTLVKTIKERTFEIGMLRSLGFKPSFIKSLFILESIFLSWLGCIAGIVLSLIISFFINRSTITYQMGLFSYESPLRVMIDLNTYVFGILMMTGLSIVAAFVAVRKPSQAIIAQTLVHV